MAPRTKPQTTENGVPQEKVFDLKLTGQEIQLVHLFLTTVPIEGAQAKFVAAHLQAKLEQLAAQENETQ